MDPTEYGRPFPRVLRIEPAAACNLQCSHCPTGTVDMKRGVMKRSTLDRVVDELKRHLDVVRVVVLYHGGEPLANKKHFLDMIRTVKTLGIPYVKTVSNGMLLKEPLARGIIISGLDAIEFSLDGTSPEENDRIRRRGKFNVIVGNIKRLIELKGELGAELPKVYISTTQFIDPATHRQKDQEAEVPDYLRRTFDGPYASEVEFKCTYAMRWPHMNVLEDMYDVYSDPFDTEDGDFCDHVVSTMTIRANGDVVACCYDITSQCVLGNVNDRALADIWNSDAFLELRRSIDTRQFNPLCANCNVVRPNVYLVLKPDAAGPTAELREDTA